jgi:hypothetical protein
MKPLFSISDHQVQFASFLMILVFLFSCTQKKMSLDQVTVNSQAATQQQEASSSEITPEVPFSFESIQYIEPNDYLSWVENPENGMIVTQKVNDMVFSLMYKPLDYVALKELKKENVDALEIIKVKGQLEDMQYFTLRIASTSSNDLLKSQNASSEDYNQRIQYFSFHMQNDISLVDGPDTLRCVLHHFERTYGLAPFRNFVLGFKQPESTSSKDRKASKTVIFEDKVFGKGTIKLKVKSSDLWRIPEIKTNEI